MISQRVAAGVIHKSFELVSREYFFGFHFLLAQESEDDSKQTFEA